MIHSTQWPSRPFWSLSVLPLLLPLFLPTSTPAQSRPLEPTSGDSAALFDGVVVAPRQGLAFLMRPGGGIDAVELATGAVRWHSDRAAKPLALAGNRLIAQAESRGSNALELVALDLRNGAARDSARVPLPAGVTASVMDPPGGSFRVRVEGGEAQLELRWQASGAAAGDPAQGYMPAADEGAAPTLQEGAAVIGVAAAQMTVEPSALSAAATARPALEELSVPAVKAEGRQWRSTDGRHVLVSKPVATSEFTLYHHRWTVYEAKSGARLGSVQALVSATPFLVVGGMLYHVSPLYFARQDGRMVQHAMALRAVNLQSGVEAWKLPVLDTAFRGPFPP